MDDLAAIEQLKYRYLRTLDTKDWPAFADCFVPDVTGDYAGLVFGSRDELVGYMRANLGDDVVTMHHCHHPEITVDGDAASGVWYLEDKVYAVPFRFVLEGAGIYQDRYVRTPDGWRFQHTGYRRTFEVTWSMDDVPSFKIDTNPTPHRTQS